MTACAVLRGRTVTGARIAPQVGGGVVDRRATDLRSIEAIAAKSAVIGAPSAALGCGHEQGGLSGENVSLGPIARCRLLRPNLVVGWPRWLSHSVRRLRRMRTNPDVVCLTMSANHGSRFGPTRSVGCPTDDWSVKQNPALSPAGFCFHADEVMPVFLSAQLHSFTRGRWVSGCLIPLRSSPRRRRLRFLH